MIREPTTGATLRAAYDDLYAGSILRESADYYAWIGRLLRWQPGEKLLDIGCGVGLLFQALKPGPNGVAIGVDFSERALRLARQAHLPPSVCVAEAERLPLPAGLFNCVTCLGSLEHFSDPAAALAEMRRLVRADGRLLLVVPNSYFVLDILNAWWRGLRPTHGQPLERFAALEEWRALLEDHGLEVTQVVRHNNTGVFSRAVFRWVWRLTRPYIPLRMSYQFVFLCRPRQPQRVAAKPNAP
jgi:ubiquinone/menaquinone biosynthesis C-methylase UbiE